MPRRVLLLLLPLVLGGCAAITRPPATTTSIYASGVAHTASQRALVDSVTARLVRRVAARGDRTLDVLLLSGGGQNGAYGAGFLRGWRARRDQPMPTFDLITGVSTGALQAPWVLRGRPEDLDTLSTLYLQSVQRFAPTLDWWFWARRTGGVANMDRFQGMLRSTLNPGFTEELREEFAKDRQLLVETADLDLGLGRVWDLSQELQGSPAGRDRTREILTAASAIPGIFPPVVLDGHVHADGGVIQNLIPVLELDGLRLLARRLREAGVPAPVTVRVWAIMNTWTHAEPKVIDPSRRKQIASRGNWLLFMGSQPQLLQRLDAVARAASAELPELKVEFRHTQIPAHLALEPGAQKLFDAAWMARLERLGVERAGGAEPWDRATSPFEQPPR